MTETIVWRSLMFVPANNERFIEKAHTRGADGIILDLQDSVPKAERPAARQGLADAVRAVGQSGADVLVRINRPMEEAALDIDAAVIPGVRALKVALAESGEHLRLLSEMVSEKERERGLPEGSVLFLPMIEGPAALMRAEEIARATPRNAAMILGAEDFAADIGMIPDEDTLMLPNQMLLYAAGAAGIAPLGLFGTVADFKDLDAYRLRIRKARKFGFVGTNCVHPANVAILNEEFAPTKEEVEKAERIVAAYEEAEARGTGAIEVDGKMIDVPVARRAAGLAARARVIAARGN